MSLTTPKRPSHTILTGATGTSFIRTTKTSARYKETQHIYKNDTNYNNSVAASVVKNNMVLILTKKYKFL